MSYAATFDTHKAIKRLTSQGISPVQAEVFVEVIRESQATTGGDLVTKADLKAELAELETRLTNTLMNAHREDMRWIFGFFLAVIGLLVSVLLKLH